MRRMATCLDVLHVRTSCGASGRRLLMLRLHFASSSIRLQLVCRRPEVSHSTRSAPLLTAESTACRNQRTDGGHNRYKGGWRWARRCAGGQGRRGHAIAQQASGAGGQGPPQAAPPSCHTTDAPSRGGALPAPPPGRAACLAASCRCQPAQSRRPTAAPTPRAAPRQLPGRCRPRPAPPLRRRC